MRRCYISGHFKWSGKGQRDLASLLHLVEANAQGNVHDTMMDRLRRSAIESWAKKIID